MRGAVMTVGFVLALASPAAAQSGPPLTDAVDRVVESVATPVAEVLEAPAELLGERQAPVPTPAATQPPEPAPTAAATPQPTEPRVQPTTREPVARATPSPTPIAAAAPSRPARSSGTRAPSGGTSVRPNAQRPAATPTARKRARRAAPPAPRARGRLTRIIALVPGWVKIVLAAAALGLAILFAALLRSRRQLAAAVRRAHRDSLTGLPNRAAFEDALALMAAQSARARAPMAVIMLDLDHFKSINDAHGHQAGDAVLSQLGKLMRESIRGGDFVARYGGEELILLLPGTDLHGAGRLAEALRRKIAAAGLGDLPAPVTASLGVAAATGEIAALTALVATADAALYEAKDAGRDRVVLARAPEPQVLLPA